MKICDPSQNTEGCRHQSFGFQWFHQQTYEVYIHDFTEKNRMIWSFNQQTWWFLSKNWGFHHAILKFWCRHALWCGEPWQWRFWRHRRWRWDWVSWLFWIMGCGFFPCLRTATHRFYQWTWLWPWLSIDNISYPNGRYLFGTFCWSHSGLEDRLRHWNAQYWHEMLHDSGPGLGHVAEHAPLDHQWGKNPEDTSDSDANTLKTLNEQPYFNIF